MRDFSSHKVKCMSTIAEASELLRALAEPRPVGDTVKAAIRRAQRILSIWQQKNSIAHWSGGRARKIWYCDSNIVVSADELEQLRGCHASKIGIERADTVFELRVQIAILADRLSRIDHEFDPASLEGLGQKTPDESREADDTGGGRGINHKENPR
jgi:hypothetical protein